MIEDINAIDSSFLEFIMPNEHENKILDELDSLYIEISEMTEHERQFLNALILRNKPKKLFRTRCF